MTQDDRANILAGTWRGRYFYSGDTTGNAFEIFFAEAGETIECNIVDDSQFGEANFSGTIKYPNLNFIKHYINPELDPVEYTGTMDEDHLTLHGMWFINPQVPGLKSIHGTWIARKDVGSGQYKIQQINEYGDTNAKEINKCSK